MKDMTDTTAAAMVTTEEALDMEDDMATNIAIATEATEAGAMVLLLFLLLFSPNSLYS